MVIRKLAYLRDFSVTSATEELVAGEPGAISGNSLHHRQADSILQVGPVDDRTIRIIRRT
jgi:hypothetical protein